MNASLIGKQGNLAQLGGEFIMGPGEFLPSLSPPLTIINVSLRNQGNQCAFAHRMRHTEDREFCFEI